MGTRSLYAKRRGDFTPAFAENANASLAGPVAGYRG